MSVNQGVSPLGNPFNDRYPYTLPQRDVATLRAQDFWRPGDGQDAGPMFLRALLAGQGKYPQGFGLYIGTDDYYLYSLSTFGGVTAGIPWTGGPLTIFGDGPGLSRIHYTPNMPNQSYIIQIQSARDVTIRDLTIDGEAASQSTAAGIDAQYGCRFYNSRRVQVVNCLFRNVFGTTHGALGPNGTPGEGFHQQFDNCIDFAVLNSHCEATVVNTSSGFASNGSTNGSRHGCSSYGMGQSMGFTDFSSQNVAHHGCHSYLNAQNGFLAQSSASMWYYGCTGGGVVNPGASSYSGYTPGQSLGNTQHGFNCLSSHEVGYFGCEGDHNGGYGLTAGAAGAANIRWHGGKITNNGTGGINLDANSNGPNFELVGEVIMSGNTNQDIFTAGTPSTITGVRGALGAAPAFPATGVAWTSAFPFPVLVLVNGGAITAVTVDGYVSPVFTGYFLLRPGAQITFTYTGSPTWKFFSLL